MAYPAALIQDLIGSRINAMFNVKIRIKYHGKIL
jgi:hypothetical protein